MDVVFINPSGLGSSGFPYGIATLAQILRDRGFHVGVVDASAKRLDEEKVVSEVLGLDPKVVGITGLVQTSAFNKNVSDMLRRRCPALKQVAGGWWAGPVAEFVLRNTSVDCVVKGEADLIIDDLVSALLTGGAVVGIPGVCYLSPAGIYMDSPDERLPSDMNALPLPAYDLFQMEFYIERVDPEKYSMPLHPVTLRKLRERKEKALNIISMTSGRGCYGKCDFCSAAGLVRRNCAPGHVVDHMELLLSRYGVNTFNFTESLTLSTKSWVRDLCAQIIRRKLNIYYIVLARADFVYDAEILGLLRDSGCIMVAFGFESGNNEMLARFNKKTTVERYDQVIHDFESHGIRVAGSLILNMPGESAASLKDSGDFIERTKVLFGYGFAYPYPGTALFDFAVKNGFATVKDVMFTSSNKRLTSRRLFNEYVQKFNWNDLGPQTLWQVDRRFKALIIRNYFYHRNKNGLVRSFMDRCPGLSIGLLSFHKAMEDGVLFFWRLPGRVLRKLRSRR